MRGYHIREGKEGMKGLGELDVFGEVCNEGKDDQWF